MTRDDEPIAAQATAPGKGGIGVVRISGADIGAVVRGLLGRTPAERVATTARFLDAQGVAIDHGVALYFQGPRSYTGQDVLELQGHGGPVVQQLLLRRCLELGCRLAEPGEFTRRAYLNDKLDLAQAEGVADLIEASSARAVRAALRSLDGHFSAEVHTLRDQLVELRALTEATLDFPEEEIDFLEKAQARERLEALAAGINGLLARARQGARLKSGLTIVLAGRPNVGKSSLLNALAGEEAAIVTAVPGTTRDTISRSITIEGLAIHVIDTAGLRETADEVEAIGIARTRRAIARADLVLHLVDAAGETEADRAAAAEIPAGIPLLTVANKIDAAGLSPATTGDRIRLSAKTHAGLDLLRAELLRRAGLEGAGEDLVLARERHLEALEAALGAVEAALAQLAGAAPAIELMAEELRLAQEAMNRITGEFGADDLLGEIFGRFCIGK